MVVRFYCALCFLFLAFRALSQNAIFISPGGTIQVQAGGQLIVKGSSYLSNGSSIVNAGSIRLNNSSRNYWLDSSFSTGSVSGTGKIYFEGTAAIDLYGNNEFYDAVINGTSVNIDSPYVLSINHQVYLQKGVIKTNKSVLKLLNEYEDAITADAGNAGYSQSWINGRLDRKIGSNTMSYVFPIGDSAAPHAATLINNYVTGINELTISFEPKKGNDAGLHAFEGFNYAGVHDRGIWYASANGAINGGNFNLRLSIDGFTGLNDNQFGILARPFTSTDGSEWAVPTGSSLPVSGSAGRTISGGFAQRNFISTLYQQQFGIGFTSAPLPVTLIGLKAQRINRTVRLSWSTLNETNNKGFFIQRQKDATDFKTIGFVASKAMTGNSANKWDYLFTDSDADSRVNRYRLQQANVDGSFQYSPIVSVNAEKNQDVVYPNPTKDLVYIRLSIPGNYEVSISNGEGRIVRKQNIRETASLHLSDLVSGYYTITIRDARNAKVLTQKVLLLKD
jgi:hypothetical protein